MTAVSDPFYSEVKQVMAPIAGFGSAEVDSPDTVRRWRRTACEQGLYYRDHRRELADRYRGEYIFLQDSEVVWHGEPPCHLHSRRPLSGARKDSAMWLNLADPEEREGERFEVYEECLRLMDA